MMPPLRCWAVLCLASVLLIGCVDGGDDASRAEGHAQMAEFREALEAARAALAANNLEEVITQDERARAALESARAAFEKADLTTDATAREAYAEALLSLGEPDLATEHFQALVEEQPAKAALWLNLGKSLSRLGPAHWPEAQQAFEQARTLSADGPVQLEVQRDLAELYGRMGLYPLAEAAYQDVLEESPDDRRALVGKAMLDIRRGNVTGAMAALETAGADAPRFVPDFAARLRDALQDFEQGRMTFADTAGAHLAYAKLLLQAGRVAESRPALERSLHLDDSDYTVWNMLGSVAQQMGDAERAREAFTRSLALNDDQPRTRQALDALGDPAR